MMITMPPEQWGKKKKKTNQFDEYMDEEELEMMNETWNPETEE